MVRAYLEELYSLRGLVAVVTGGSSGIGRAIARGFGRIIDLASQQAVRAFNHSGAYGVSKGGVAVLLAGRSSGYVTGQTIFVDGGFSAT